MKTAPETLTVLEYNRLLGVLLDTSGTKRQKALSVRNYTMGLLMGDAGLRVGEVVRLLETDLIFGGEPVTNLCIRREISKNKKERLIPVGERLRHALKAMQSGWWWQCLEGSVTFAFYNDKSIRPLTTRQVERIIGNASYKAFGRRVHPHILRHTFASCLARVTDIRTVQEILGHKQVTSTQVYTHPNNDDKRKAIEAKSRYESEQNSQNS